MCLELMICIFLHKLCFLFNLFKKYADTDILFFLHTVQILNLYIWIRIFYYTNLIFFKSKSFLSLEMQAESEFICHLCMIGKKAAKPWHPCIKRP